MAIELETGFFGRERELRVLREQKRRDLATFIVVTGRRRIGKSRLVREYAKDFDKFFSFTALPPESGMSAQDQRNEFAAQFSRQLILPRFEAIDWGELFVALANQIRLKESTLVLLDEVSWMAKHDRSFLGKLKNAWDLHFSVIPGLVLVVCGSVSSWIEKNILSGTGFVGRVSQSMVIGPLGLRACNQFWGEAAQRVSAREKLSFLSVTGGIPRYLEELKPQESTESNVIRLCFREGALLYDEFDKLFSDLFDRRSTTYKKIIKALSGPPLTYIDLTNILGLTKSGTLSSYLDDLATAGFISKDYSWSIATKRVSKRLTYRLSDNYLRFYLKVIEPNRLKISQTDYGLSMSEYLPEWQSILGLQFENFVLQNRGLIFDHLHIDPSDVVASNPYLQTKTKRRKGCQIDLLIQTRFNTLYVCEVKFSNKTIDESIYQPMREKLERLECPKNYSLRPVLIYSGSLSEAVEKGRYFDKAIDIGSLFE